MMTELITLFYQMNLKAALMAHNNWSFEILTRDPIRTAAWKYINHRNHRLRRQEAETRKSCGGARVDLIQRRARREKTADCAGSFFLQENREGIRISWWISLRFPIREHETWAAKLKNDRGRWGSETDGEQTREVTTEMSELKEKRTRKEQVHPSCSENQVLPEIKHERKETGQRERE